MNTSGVTGCVAPADEDGADDDEIMSLVEGIPLVTIVCSLGAVLGFIVLGPSLDEDKLVTVVAGPVLLLLDSVVERELGVDLDKLVEENEKELLIGPDLIVLSRLDCDCTLLVSWLVGLNVVSRLDCGGTLLVSWLVGLNVVSRLDSGGTLLVSWLAGKNVVS